VVLKSIFFWDMTPCSALSGVLARCVAELFYDPEDGGDTFLRNVGYHLTHYTASYLRRRYSSEVLLTKRLGLHRQRYLTHSANIIHSFVFRWKRCSSFACANDSTSDSIRCCYRQSNSRITVTHKKLKLKLITMSPVWLYVCVYLCVPYGSHNKQRLFPQTALTGWAL
jgi:hypothetical protein